MSAISLSNLVPQPSGTNTGASASVTTFWQKYISERRPEVQQLDTALKSGDLKAAEQAYNNLVSLGNTVLGKDNPFTRSDRALDFNAIGGALQNGDLAGAQQAFAALESTFKLPPTSASLNGPPVAVNLTAAKDADAGSVNVIA
jgi:hypothetical protein